jgi:hypothetical protein
MQCKVCGKPSWAGCGAHVEQVLGHVAPSDRCQGHAEERSANGGLISRLFAGRTGGQ